MLFYAHAGSAAGLFSHMGGNDFDVIEVERPNLTVTPLFPNVSEYLIFKEVSVSIKHIFEKCNTLKNREI